MMHDMAEAPAPVTQVERTPRHGEPEAELPAPDSPAGPAPMQEDEAGDPIESGAGEGPESAETDAWMVPVPEDEEHETLELRNKSFKKGQKGKELEAKWFNDHEWEVFRDADREQ